jgi:O-antigen ligase
MTRRLEVGALVALSFFLPLYEAPKSIFWALYVLIWLANRIRARDFGGRWDAWDSLIAAWLASGFVVAAFAGIPGGDEWRGTVDLLRYGGVLWLAKRSRYTESELRRILLALLASTVIGLIMGYAAVWKGAGPLTLNSVGQVNHSAIYAAIVLGLAASWLFAAWRTWSVEVRALAIAVNVFLLFSIVVMASRAAVGVALAMLLLLAAAWWRRSRAPLLAMAIALLVTLAGVFAGGAEVLRKHEANVRENNLFAYRLGIWQMAIETWQRHPWFGVGMDNFGRVAQERAKLAGAQPGEKDYDRGKYLDFPHAHSLLLNTLAERGAVGTAALIAVLLAWLTALLRHRPRREHGAEAWLLWGAAAAAWLVTVGVGMVNTTLHDEHGLLAALLTGLWLSRIPKG